MPLLPERNIILKTHLNEHEVMRRLGSAVDTNYTTVIDHSYWSKKDYQGVINGNTFLIRAFGSGATSITPEISGTVKKADQGALVYISIRLSFYAILLSWFSLGGTVLFGFALFAKFLASDDIKNDAPGPFIFCICIYVVITVVFSGASISAQRNLQKLLS